MINQKLAQIFFEIGDYLSLKGVPFKPYAYQKVALLLDGMEQDVGQIYRKGGTKALEMIPGIGESIAKKIEEYIKTGKIKYYEKLKKEIPVKMSEMTSVEGIGPKTVLKLYKYLDITNLKELEKAIKEHRVRGLSGFGAKTEEKIMRGIKFFEQSQGRFLLGDILPVARCLRNNMSKVREVERVDICGSTRRRKETIGDMDFLAISEHPKYIVDYFVSQPNVVTVYGRGETKAMIRIRLDNRQEIDVDLRIIPKQDYGAALQYFTGNKDHNIALRKMAVKRKMKLNEYGLFKRTRNNQWKKLVSKTEESIYHRMGMDWIAPELRTNNGEIKAALEHKLPKIIGYKDIKGDLHCHTNWDGGNNSIREMAQRAIEMGEEYLGITDHTKALKIEHGLDEKKLFRQGEEINKINKELERKGIRFRVLKGCEANILKDGSLDISDRALKKLDYAIAGVHSDFNLSRRKMTDRIIKAMENPYIKIIAHPTGRILKQRPHYKIDFDRILAAAKRTRTILEINSQPTRLDLDFQNIRRAKEKGVKMVIDTDAHYVDHLRYMELGIAQARRGWAEKKDIINTRNLKGLLKYFSKK